MLNERLVAERPHFSLQLLPALGIFHFLNTNELKMEREREEGNETNR